MEDIHSICRQFGQLLRGKSRLTRGVCSVSLNRGFPVLVQGRPSVSVASAEAQFESLGPDGRALNLSEIALLPEEVPAFTQSVSRQGLNVTALHNHWLYTEPELLYIHLQSVEPPLHFAQKLANAFTVLRTYPVPEHE
ncbi:DUF1259 domain-containing protein [Cohnella nanjingensis]|uniref:DUF1259 domain-containing protein n=1 Tax=Cohnella nanjingensis TaxID=1387779 RepID=A0A7X0VF39_9BACL|nr:DUF1259 domain-containing protein [Cohnella nanjingensis]MBB6671647.1 DUF1259 domain-containing protein [Cohnella nanjingensis]